MHNRLRRGLAAALCAALAFQSWPSAAAEFAAPEARGRAVEMPLLLPGVPLQAPAFSVPSSPSQDGAVVSAGAETAPGASAAPAAASSFASPAQAEFGSLRREAGPGLAARIWRHAVSRGFVRPKDSVVAASGEPGEPAPSLAPSSEAPAGGHHGPPTPPPSRPERLSVLSGKVLGFFSTFLLIQLAVESLALAIPQMTDPLRNGFLALAGLSSTSYLAYSAGSFLGGRLVQRLGISRVYRTVLSARAVIWAGAAAVFHAHSGVIPIMPLIGLFSVDYFVHSIGRVAEHTLQAEWFKDSPVASNRFGTMRDFVEYGTVFTTMGTGLVIATLGFGAIIYAAPVMFGVAALLAAALRSLPQRSAQKPRRVPFFAGFRRLWRPQLRNLFLSRLLINNFVYLLYYVTGTAFGAYFARGNTRLAAEAASALIGLLGMGANVASVINTWLSRRFEKKTEGLSAEKQAAAQGALMQESAAKAMRWAALALLGGWLFVSQAKIGSLVWPLFAVSPALILIGLTGQLAWTQLDTLLKDRMPKRTKAYVVGADRTLTNLSYVVNFLVWGALFQFFGAQAFAFLGVYCTLTAVAYLWLSRRLGGGSQASRR